MLGDGQGSLVLHETVTAFESPNEVLLDNINGDDKLDLFVTNYGTDLIGAYINRGTVGAPTFPDAIPIDVSSSPRSIARADFDGDARNDLMVGTANGVFSMVLTEN